MQHYSNFHVSTNARRLQRMSVRVTVVRDWHTLEALCRTAKAAIRRSAISRSRHDFPRAVFVSIRDAFR